jgi:aromatic-L-amino-acid decarboxylase
MHTTTDSEAAAGLSAPAAPTFPSVSAVSSVTAAPAAPASRTALAAAAAPASLANLDADELTLDPQDWVALHDLGHRMVDDLLYNLRTVRERPVWQPVPAEVAARFRRPLPEKGVGAERAYEDFVADVQPYPLGNTHPRFWGWVIGSGSPLGALADLLAAGFNANVSGLRSAAIHVEEQVLDWLKELLGFPPAASGLLASGGSMANLLGLAVGLDARAEFDLAQLGLGAAPRRMTLYASRETHSSVDKAVRLLGLGREALRKIPVDGRFRVDVEAMEAAIRDDRARGHHPFLVVGNAGTVNTGACDDLDRLADLAAREEMWLHVDGAFGAFAAAVPELRPLVRGMERADSLAFDLHKWMHTPIEAACVLVRDPEAHRRAFAYQASYLEPLARGVGHQGTRFADYGMQLSRGFRALKLWLEIKAHGAELYRGLVAQNVAQARRLAALVAAAPELELLAPVDLNIVCFRHAVPGFDEEELASFNRELLMRLQERGAAVPSHTTLGGKFALRACITNHRTRREDLELLVETVRRYGRELLGVAA